MRPLQPLDVALDGTLLVEASAGTGKTHTITTLVARLVIERGLPIDRILVVTFTEAATAELRHRVRERLLRAVAALDDPESMAVPDPEMVQLVGRLKTAQERDRARARARKALDDFDLASISTIHAFCKQALEEHAFESGARFDLELVTDLRPMVQDVADDRWATQTYGLPRDVYLLVQRSWKHERVSGLVGEIARRPASTRVLPGGEPSDSGSAVTTAARTLAHLRELFAEAGRIWSGQQAALIRLLWSGALNGRSYPQSDIGAWCDDMTRYLTGDDPLRFPAKFEWWGADSVTAAKKKNQTAPVHRFFDVAQLLFEGRQQATDALLRSLRQSAVAHTHRELSRRKALGGVRGFDDLLESLDAALRGPLGGALATALRGRYGAALIDEFQDTDPVQYRVFRQVFHGAATLILVGDPKQSIYAFRGADVFSYLAAANDAGDARHTLTTSYRSDPSLVRAVNAVFGSGPGAFLFETIAFHPATAHAPADRLRSEHPAFELLLHQAQTGLKDEIAGFVAGDIARRLRADERIEGKPVVAGDIAVLTRSNDQATAVQDALRRLGIPSVLETEASVFASDEAAELERVLHAIAEPTRAGVVRSALATVLVGLSADGIVDLETDETKWDAWSERFRSLRDLWQDRGFIVTYRRLLHELKAEERLLALYDGERRLTNLSHLAELLHRAALASRIGMMSLLQWFSRMRTDKAAQDQALGSAASQLRLENDDHAVKVLTVHKSKGLEYPIVYCPYLWWGYTFKSEVTAYHDPKRGDELTLHLEPDADATAQHALEAKAEDQRLLYVALTRAKHKVCVVWGPTARASQHASSSLAHALHRDDKIPYKDLDFEGLRRALAPLTARSGNTIGVRELVARDESPFPPASSAEGQLKARTFDRSIDRRWRMSSFSALTKDAGEAPVAAEVEERDRDEQEDVAVDLDVGGATTSVDVTLADFPRGSRAGTMLHEVFELHDFTAPESELRARVETTLRRHGFDAAALADSLTRGVREVLETPLDDTRRLLLASVTRRQRLDELEFVFPVAARGASGPAFAKSRLARVFAEHPSDTLPAGYPEQLHALSFGEMRGFLRGFVDLVFEHEGRFYVVDYKSNHLGRTATDYGPSQLRAAMMHANYYLQYHLYVVALHRYLARRVRAYSYEGSFGGVYYLFARGMAPANGRAGIFFDRPPEARIEALSRCLDGVAQEAAHA
jgi:exodeoxyribonuclease V beta subunit